ncbi:MAG: hypothetical protein JOY72_06055 [Actinobacteria bacterium]|nr:hypothetical protein [Actinomycetota bacterium]
MSARRTGSAALLAGVSAVLVFSAGSPAAPGPGGREGALRAEASALASRVQSASLDLYALDARLHRAQARLASLDATAAQLEARQRQIEQQIGATRKTLRKSQRNLGTSLRILYEQGDTDPVAVILGAESLTDAVSTLDGLRRVSDQSSALVQTATRAEVRLRALRADLVAQRARVAESVREAAGTTRQLASARANRISFIGSLRAQEQLRNSQVDALEASVQRAEAKSQQLTAQVAASGPVAGVVGDPGSSQTPPTTTTPAAAPSSGDRTLVVSATGYALPGHTATGLPVGWGIVAVDPTVIPLGTRMTIPGYGEGVAADVGSGIRGAMIDLWFPTVQQAYQWGRRTVTITLH